MYMCIVLGLFLFDIFSLFWIYIIWIYIFFIYLYMFEYIYIHKYIYIQIYLSPSSTFNGTAEPRQRKPLWCSTLGRCTPRCAPVTLQRPCRPSTLRAVRCRCGWWVMRVGWLVGVGGWLLSGATERGGQTYYEINEILKNFGRFFWIFMDTF